MNSTLIQAIDNPNEHFYKASFWSDFEKSPVELIEANRYLCVEYKPELKEQIVNWIKLCREESLKQKALYLKIAVFADFDKLKAGEVPRLATVIGKYGATLRDSQENFSDAVKAFDDGLMRAIDRTLRYSMNRRRAIKPVPSSMENTQCYAAGQSARG